MAPLLQALSTGFQHFNAASMGLEQLVMQGQLRLEAGATGGGGQVVYYFIVRRS